MENLQYKRAVLLAETLTKSFNKNHYTYSRATWAAHEIFRKKQMHYYGIYPVVSVSKDDNNLIVTAKIKQEVYAMDTGKMIEFKAMAYDLIADLDPKDPDHLSNIVEDLLYAVQDTMYDYAEDNKMEDPEPFI